MSQDQEIKVVLDALARAADFPQDDAVVREAIAVVRSLALRYADPHLSSYTSHTLRDLEACLRYRSYEKKTKHASAADEYLRYRLAEAVKVARARKG